LLWTIIAVAALAQQSGGNGVPGAASGAAAIPATSGLLKGTGTAGSAVAATAGSDYVSPSLSTTQMLTGPLSAPQVAAGTLSATGAATAAGFFPQSGAAGPYTVLFDDYYSGANNASNNIGTPAGASCSVNTTYTDVNHPGNILLTSGTGGSGTGITCGYQNESADVITPGGTLGWSWETAVYVPVLPGTTASAYQAGLTHTPNANPWTTGIEFYLSSANTVTNDWYCGYGSTYTDTTVAAVAGSWTRLTLVSDGTKVHWYVNGTQVCGAGVAVASVPNTAQYPASWSATGLSTTSVTMAVDYVSWERAVSR
jgi:hypothetical protein